MFIRKLGRAALALGLAALVGSACAPAHASQVYINSSLITEEASLATNLGATFRLSEGGLDQVLDNGLGINSIAPGVDPFVGLNLGNAAALNGRAFDFTIAYTPAQGFLFTLTPVAGGTATAVAWGTSTADVSATSLATSASTSVGPNRSINKLNLTASIAVVPGGSSPQPSLTFSNLAFSGTGLTIADGVFNSGNLFLVASPFVSNTQTVYSDADLSAVAWTLTGRLTANRPVNVLGSDNLISFRVTGEQTRFRGGVPVPEPTSLLLLSGGIALALPWIRRRGRKLA